MITTSETLILFGIFWSLIIVLGYATDWLERKWRR